MKVALLGCGVVGTEVARLLTTQADELAARVGAPLELAGIAVRRLGRDRGLQVDPALFTTDAEELVTRADVVVEVIGGIEPARSLMLRAIEHGASVVTANKALLAADGPTLYEAAAERGVDLYYEASVAGAIPLLRPLRESLVGDRVTRVLGIVNGTTNYVLDQMDTTGTGYAEAVEQAQALGYAEADPTADVEGFDAAAKAAILASLAFHTRVSLDDVHREGISEVSAADVRAAQAQGCVVKLLAIAERSTGPGGEDAVSVRVHPAMMPREHQLAGVRGAFNAVFVEAEAAGELMFYGPGAGGGPTASAVLGDVVAAARHRRAGGRGPGESAYADLPVLPMDDTVTRYHVRLDVADKPGVLAQVAGVFAAHGVSIEAVQQRQEPAGPGGRGRAVLVVVTHSAPDAALAATVDELEDLEIVDSVAGVMRVEGHEARAEAKGGVA
ncbi:homoserine dehydrogenase [Kineococcus sp. TRM81007]|uniref:homoserine dehydrogenase n=1 Tax=Kineococcus sp. TRM81007 TaxID=2925831 RepID=UPI001F5706DC|nr:homoserine dehydrogenase [Kineococcus sp. TRM81007]MCI2239291.1 homoserine dehydrogenase [Kineococcus sp. TRM81007]